ncbi:hypothetical protein Tco_0044761 [Tanacetum coccineum]
MEEGRINGNELKTELKKIRTQIIKLQKKQLGQKDKIAFAHYRISDLERIIEKIQARRKNGKLQRVYQLSTFQLKVRKESEALFAGYSDEQVISENQEKMEDEFYGPNCKGSDLKLYIQDSKNFSILMSKTLFQILRNIYGSFQSGDYRKALKETYYASKPQTLEEGHQQAHNLMDLK